MTLDIYNVKKYGFKSELSRFHYGNSILWVKKITYTIKISVWNDHLLLLPSVAYLRPVLDDVLEELIRGNHTQSLKNWEISIKFSRAEVAERDQQKIAKENSVRWKINKDITAHTMVENSKLLLDPGADRKHVSLCIFKIIPLVRYWVFASGCIFLL